MVLLLSFLLLKWSPCYNAVGNCHAFGEGTMNEEEKFYIFFQIVTVINAL